MSGPPALSGLPALAARLAALAPNPPLPPDRPPAAVAVILAPDPDSIVLIRRAEREGDTWSGQLALPGGRWGAADPDLVTTARRETREEVGLDLSTARLVGPLPDLAPRTPVLPPIVVRPFVFLLPGQQPLHPNHEVAGAWWIPLVRFTRPGTFAPTEFRRQGTLVRTSGYHLEMGILWGMTERILTPLLELLGPDPASR